MRHTMIALLVCALLAGCSATPATPSAGDVETAIALTALAAPTSTPTSTTAPTRTPTSIPTKTKTATPDPCAPDVVKEYGDAVWAEVGDAFDNLQLILINSDAIRQATRARHVANREAIEDLDAPRCASEMDEAALDLLDAYIDIDDAFINQDADRSDKYIGSLEYLAILLEEARDLQDQVGIEFDIPDF